MTGFVFMIFFSCLNCLLFPCKGKVSAPSAGTILTLAPGSTERISWSFDDVIDLSTRRIWSFTPSNGQPRVSLATIDDDDPVKILTSLFDFALEKPATLVLKNVNLTYNGTYQFGLIPSVGASSSEVVVYIAVKPWVRVGCHSWSIVNITDNFTCLCEAAGGNPAPYVTWYKGKKKIGESGKEKQTLRLINVNRDDAVTFKCEAKSHHSAISITEIELIVNYPPENVMLKLTRCGDSATIKCSAEAQPSASFKIFFNETELVLTDKAYTISEVNVSHLGNYTCVAKNIMGSNTSNSQYLFFIEDKKPSNNISFRTEWYIFVVTLVAGIVFGVLFSYIAFCSCRKFKSRNTHSSPEPRATEVDKTYQELDLKKMDKEDNYQSLRVNAASDNVANDVDPNYTDLSKARDVENNYQSLI